MKISPRVKLVLIAAGFALPVAISLIAYFFARPEPTANYGELLLPPQEAPAMGFQGEGSGSWDFAQLRGRWALVMSDSGACAGPCLEKLTTLRQVRLALGRNASRVARVYVVDDRVQPDPGAMRPFEGTQVAIAPSAGAPAPAWATDRAHLYLVDPHGNVMMRWPAVADRKRMLKDLERLLKASQIGHNHGLANTAPC